MARRPPPPQPVANGQPPQRFNRSRRHLQPRQLDHLGIVRSPTEQRRGDGGMPGFTDNTPKPIGARWIGERDLGRGGTGSIPGTFFGGLFVLFVPNIAEQFSKGLAGAVYGIILLLVIYLMPTGAAGLVRLISSRLVQQGRAGG